jgi:hypothetical protein
VLNRGIETGERMKARKEGRKYATTAGSTDESMEVLKEVTDGDTKCGREQMKIPVRAPGSSWSLVEVLQRVPGE